MLDNNFIHVDLGCGKNKLEGAIGIDSDPSSKPDILIDFERDRIPLNDNSVDRISFKHLFEHLKEPLELLKEVYRIAKDGAEIFVEVPHYSSHISHGLGHLHYFSYKEMLQIFNNNIECSHVNVELHFYKTFRFFGISFLANKFPENYERFWAYIFPAENIKVVAIIKKDKEHCKYVKKSK